MRNLFLILYCFIHFIGLSKPVLAMKDTIYNPNVKTVQFYQLFDSKKDVILPATFRLGDQNRLRLEFDLLQANFSNFQAKIYYCSQDWKEVVPINAMNYLEEYNEFSLYERDYSSATKIGYTHYSFTVPKILLSGNYILQILEADSRLPVLERRFMVYEKEAKINPLVFPLQSNLSDKQQINFEVTLDPDKYLNPLQNVYIYIRQNGINNTTTPNLKPTYYQQIENKLTFNGIQGPTIFYGGNEYRKFDMRSTMFKGMGIDNISKENEINKVQLKTDQSRKIVAYSRDGDINGRFVIDNYEFDDGALNSDYILTMFKLDYPKVDGNVYIYGQMSNWNLLPEFKMEYNEETKLYLGAPILKQGYYNYKYVLEKNGKIDENYFEGSFWQTENYYEILVYYKQPGVPEEHLIGYEIIKINPWN